MISFSLFSIFFNSFLDANPSILSIISFLNFSKSNFNPSNLLSNSFFSILSTNKFSISSIEGLVFKKFSNSVFDILSLFNSSIRDIFGKFSIELHKLSMAWYTSALFAFKPNTLFISFKFTFDLNCFVKSFIIYPWFFTVSANDLNVTLIISFIFFQSLLDYKIYYYLN